jgi:hypothetical protein
LLSLAPINVFGAAAHQQAGEGGRPAAMHAEHEKGLARHGAYYTTSIPCNSLKASTFGATTR